MSGDERRSGARFLTELTVVLRSSKGGEPIDDRATAHEVSVRGFKLETQAALSANTTVFFTFELPMGGRAVGKGRVVWSKRETFSTWAGIEIVSMPWSDKRRLAQVLNPDRANWSRLTDLCVKLVMILTVVVATQRVLNSAQLRGLVALLAPKTIALFLMGWALVGLLKPKKR